MKCAGCGSESVCECVKCMDFWPVPHRLPRIHWCDGKLLRGQHYEAYPFLVNALLALHPSSVEIYPNAVMVCVPLERSWDRLEPKIRAILSDHKMLNFNGGISSTNKPHKKILWCHHGELPNRARRRLIRQGRYRIKWTDHDLDLPLTVALMPRLIKLLLECHNVGELEIINEDYPGIIVAQKFPDGWSKTMIEIVSVLRDGFVERIIHPPEPGTCYSPYSRESQTWRWKSVGDVTQIKYLNGLPLLQPHHDEVYYGT